MKNRHSDEGCDIKPDGYIEMFFAAFPHRHQHVDAKYYPDDGNSNINGPLQFSIFLTGIKAHWQRYNGRKNDRLPSPEVNFTEPIAPHRRFTQAGQ